MCVTCGTDVATAIQHVATARQKLELWHEKLTVEAELLKSDKRNWKRRCQIARNANLQRQRNAEQLERENEERIQLLQAQVVALQDETRESAAAAVAATSAAAEAVEQQHWNVQKEEHQRHVEELHQQIQRLEIELEAAQRKKESPLSDNICGTGTDAEPNDESEFDTILENDVQVTPRKGDDTNDDENSTLIRDLQDQVESLKAQLDDKMIALESLEMQLLELERDRDDHPASATAAGEEDDLSHVRHDATPCPHCHNLQLQLSEAQEQIRKHELELVQMLRRQRHEASHASSSSGGSRTSGDATTPAPVTDNDDNNATQQQQQEQQQRAELQNQQHEQTIARLEAKLRELHLEAQQERARVQYLQRQFATSQARPADAVEASYAAETDALSSNDNTTDTGVAPEPDPQPPNQHRRYVKELEWRSAALARDDPSQPEWMGRYTGYVNESGNPDGPGTLRVDDGAILDTDNWKDGRPHGNGVFADLEGNVYRGHYNAEGQKDGPDAVFAYGDGRVYRGSFAGDVKHGHGVLTWPYGAWYEGAFASGRRNGPGEYHYADGRVYVGTYQNDRAHGYGVLRAPDGTVIYDGDWELGEFLGIRRQAANAVNGGRR